MRFLINSSSLPWNSRRGIILVIIVIIHNKDSWFCITRKKILNTSKCFGFSFRLPCHKNWCGYIYTMCNHSGGAISLVSKNSAISENRSNFDLTLFVQPKTYYKTVSSPLLLYPLVVGCYPSLVLRQYENELRLVQYLPLSPDYLPFSLSRFIFNIHHVREKQFTYIQFI